MKINYRLSTKKHGEYHEILISIFPYVNGKVMTMRAKSGVYVREKYFDKEKGITPFSMRHSNSSDVLYHKEQAEKLHQLVAHIDRLYSDADMSTMPSDWLKREVDKYRHPERYAQKKEEKKLTFYELTEEYLRKKMFSDFHERGFKVLIRAVLRYEGFVRHAKSGRKDFIFDVDTVTRHDIEDFRDYLRNERELSEQYPELFKNLLHSYPANLVTFKNKVEYRGENTIVKLIKKLKAFFTWLYETEKTTNRPFDGVKIGTEQAGAPVYITIEERNQIASTSMPTKQLEAQRDIFIFQCLIGCRVGDLYKLTERNVTGRMLTYTPHKTKNEGEQAFVARVPLIDEAMALIEKYKGVDKQGRLFPFISQQRYNDAIKDVFTRAEITRDVEVRNALTEEMEIKPINKVASSHMARKTFIGNLYYKVQDPNLIGQMSGHVEGSRAFKRYRKIEDETLMNVIEFLK